jgi:hypothetical protein
MSAFAFFNATVIRKPCPRCGKPTGVGFAGQPEPLPEPTVCTDCAAWNFIANYCEESSQLGYPLLEQGPCARCRQPCHLYGPNGSALCDSCKSARGAR